MKKTVMLILLVLACLLVSVSPVAADRITGYTGSVANNLKFVGTQYDVNRSQGFMVSENSLADRISIRTGQDSNNVTGIIIRIETDNGTGVPSGTLVDPAATSEMQVSNPDGQLFVFNLTSNITLEVDTTYHLILKARSVGTGKYIYLMYNVSNPYTNGSHNCITSTAFDNCVVGSWSAGNASDYDLWFEINGTAAPSATVPPVINLSTINATSAYTNFTAWRTSTAGHVITQDSTPTVSFEIDTAGNCSIGLSDLNYSSMIADDANTKCSTTATTSMTCTLPATKELPFATEDSLYLSCMSSAGIENVTSAVGALSIKRIPVLEGIAISKSSFLDLTVDGTNYGETSQGWSASDNKTNYILSINTSANSYLILRATRLDATLDVRFNNKLIGTIPSNPSSPGDYRIYAFRVNSTDITSNNTVLVTAGAANSEATYIDWIALADTTPSNATIVANDTIVVYYFNTTNITMLGNTSGYVQNSSGFTTYNDNYFNINTLNTIGTENKLFVYRTKNENGNTNFTIGANSSNYGTFINISTIKTVVIDSVLPTIDTVTTTLNVLVDWLNYTFTTNITEIHPSFVQIFVNDSSISHENLTTLDNITWNSSGLVYTIPYQKQLTVQARDLANHEKNYSFVIKASNATFVANSIDLNVTHDYNTTYLDIADASATVNLTFKRIYTVTGIGDAYIDTFNITENITDTYPQTYILEYGDDSLNATIFSDNQTTLVWTTDAWNNTETATQTFNNTLTYTLNNSLQLEFENSGVNNIRLFYAKSLKRNATIENITVHVPLRTAFDGDTSSLDVFVCTSGIDWSGKTCSQFTEISSQVYDVSDPTYNFGIVNTSYYPTVDTNADGNKDMLIFRIPNVTTSGEVMFKIDLDASNAEPDWSNATTNTTTNTTTSPGGGGGGGDSGSTASSTGTTTTVPISSGNNWFSALMKSVGEWMTRQWYIIKTSWSDTTVFYILSAVLILAILYTVIGNKKKKVKNKDVNIFDL